MIRGRRDTDAARAALMARFALSERQVQAILDMRLARLTGLERKRPERTRGTARTHRRLRRSSATRSSIDGLIREETAEMKSKFGDKRRTEIADEVGTSTSRTSSQRRPASRSPRGIHQAPAHQRIPKTAPWRQGRDRRRAQGRRLHRAPLRRLDARLHPLLHERRQGLPAQGARAPARLAPVEGPRDREPAAVPPGRARARGHRDARLQGIEVPRLRDQEGRDQEDGVHSSTTRRSRPTGSSL